VQRTGDIGLFKIVSEGGIAAGVRRLEAVTGLGALELAQQREELVRGVAAQLKSTIDELPKRVASLQDEVKRLKKEIEKAARSQSTGALDQILGQAQKVGALQVVVGSIEAGGDALLALVDQAKGKLDKGSVLVLVGKEGERAPIVVHVGAEAQARGLKAGDLCKLVAGELGGGGGGNPTLGRGQGRSDRPVEPALAKARAAIAAAAGG
jgi:alanyl-tRNA synthetase